jgi:Leucine-rich repeat (LRR) protein
MGDQLRSDKNGRTFRDYEHLRALNLARNGITNLPKQIFEGIVYLMTLTLSKNSLRSLDFQFSHMKYLSQLDVSYNLISKFGRQYSANSVVYVRSKLEFYGELER